MSDVTRLLEAIDVGDSAASAALLPIVYDELRAMARQRLFNERSDHTLQATALVHEAFLRLTGGDNVQWSSRAHFFGAAAEAMRRILVDHARGKARSKRGGDFQRISLNAAALLEDNNLAQIAALDEALVKLAHQDPDLVKLVELRFFAGLTVDETAQALGMSPRTVKREWAIARAWLHDALADGGDAEGATDDSQI